MDIKTREERSRNMAKIKSSKTKPEMYIRSLLFRCGMRFRVNYAAITGKPDLYFSKQKVAVFIHGCYWHRHLGCKYAYMPKSNVDFWTRKLDGNRVHDEKVQTVLREQGIRVLILWECTVKQMRRYNDIENAIFSSVQSFILESTTDFMEL